MPGHGRSTLDTHHALPTLEASLETLERTDFAPFRALNDMPMGMTGHLLIPALDPEQCATLSPAVIGHIRDSIGFDGLLLTDDFSMGALSGDMGTRAGQALGAGCDVILHCNGERDEMAALADTVPTLTADGVRRAD